MNTLGITILIVSLGVATGQTSCKAPPSLPAGSTYTPNQGCPLGPNYQTREAPHQKCYCWDHCGYICESMQRDDASGGIRDAERNESPCPHGGIWISPQGLRCRCQSFNHQPYYLCEATTAANYMTASTTSFTTSTTTPSTTTPTTTTPTTTTPSTTIPSTTTPTTTTPSTTSTIMQQGILEASTETPGAGCCNAASLAYIETNLLSKILNSSIYYKQLRPPPYDNPTLIYVNVFINDIFFVNEKEKLWKAQLTLRQQWNDPRLAYDTLGCSEYRHLTLTSMEFIWTPDLYFPLDVGAFCHEVPQRNVLAWIAPNGDVTFSTRITLTMSCRRGKTSSEIICPLIIGSFAYTSEKMRLQWLQPDPVQIDLEMIDLSNYSVGKVATSGNRNRIANLGEFPGIVSEFNFVKKPTMCKYE